MSRSYTEADCSLHQAVRNLSVDDVLQLAKARRYAGKTIDCHCESEDTPLYNAVLRHRTDVVRALLECDANPKEPCTLGVSPLELSVILHFDDIFHQLVAFLVQKGDLVFTAVRQPVIVLARPSGELASTEQPRVVRLPYSVKPSAKPNCANVKIGSRYVRSGRSTESPIDLRGSQHEYKWRFTVGERVKRPPQATLAETVAIDRGANDYWSPRNRSRAVSHGRIMPNKSSKLVERHARFDDEYLEGNRSTFLESLVESPVRVDSLVSHFDSGLRSNAQQRVQSHSVSRERSSSSKYSAKRRNGTPFRSTSFCSFRDSGVQLSHLTQRTPIPLLIAPFCQSTSTKSALANSPIRSPTSMCVENADVRTLIARFETNTSREVSVTAAQCAGKLGNTTTIEYSRSQASGETVARNSQHDRSIVTLCSNDAIEVSLETTAAHDVKDQQIQKSDPAASTPHFSGSDVSDCGIEIQRCHDSKLSSEFEIFLDSFDCQKQTEQVETSCRQVSLADESAGALEGIAAVDLSETCTVKTSGQEDTTSVEASCATNPTSEFSDACELSLLRELERYAKLILSAEQDFLLQFAEQEDSVPLLTELVSQLVRDSPIFPIPHNFQMVNERSNDEECDQTGNTSTGEDADSDDDATLCDSDSDCDSCTLVPDGTNFVTAAEHRLRTECCDEFDITDCPPCSYL